MNPHPWRLTRLTVDGEDVDLLGAEITFEPQGERVGGSAGVNRYTGSWDDGFGPLATTMMAGPPPLMDLERAVLGALDRVGEMESVGNRLTMAGDGVTLDFVRPEIEDPMGPWMASHPDWAVADGALVLERSFDDFATAWAFADRVAEAAEAANHHPDITVGWGKATVRLFSHDAGAITDRDRALASTIDAF